MAQLVVHLGSNEGDRAAHLAGARRALRQRVGAILRASPCYETAAWGLENQADFLNQAVLINTGLSPHAVLRATQLIEQHAGRVRHMRWGPRTLDLDLLLYDQLVLDTPELQLPHPRLAERRFVLVPLHDLLPHWVHPVLNRTVGQLLAECADRGRVLPWAPSA